MIFFSAQNDWANVGYNLAESLKSVGIDALALKKKKHPWKYEKEAEIYTQESLQNAVEKSNIIIWMHSKKINVPTAGKTLFVFHGGSEYRKNPKAANAIFNEIVSKSIIQTGDLLNLGAKNEQWLLPPIDTEILQPVYDNHPKLIIAHYPSNASNKGSDVINQIIQKLQKQHNFQYHFSATQLPWKENIKRMSECDIYIDALSPTLRGKCYGEWGLQTLEAASLGKVVVTHFGSYKRYQKEYGDCALQYVNTVKELENKLKYLINLSPEKLLKLKHQTRQWVEDKHNFKAIGTRLKNILEL